VTSIGYKVANSMEHFTEAGSDSDNFNKLQIIGEMIEEGKLSFGLESGSLVPD
jgi:hypothetical protein